MTGWQKTVCFLALVITALAYEMAVLVGGFWVVFVEGQSGWWWLFVVFLLTGVAPYSYKLSNLIFLGTPAKGFQET